MLHSSLKNMEAEQAQARHAAAFPKVLASLKEFRDDLIKHARYGLNEAEVAMLKRADEAIKQAES